MSKKFLTEISIDPSDFELYTEDTAEGGKTWFIEGVFARADTPNKNKRVYPKAILEQAIARFVRDKVSQGTAWGTLGHGRGAEINLNEISHRIVGMKWDGNDLIGKAQVLDEGAGRILGAILKAGGRIGMSTRGLGNAELDGETGNKVVQDGYSIVSVDAVLDPSVGTLSKALMEATAATDTLADDDDFVGGLKRTVYKRRLSIVQAFQKALKAARSAGGQDAGAHEKGDHVNTKPTVDDPEAESTSKASLDQSNADPQEISAKVKAKRKAGSVVTNPYMRANKKRKGNQ